MKSYLLMNLKRNTPHAMPFSRQLVPLGRVFLELLQQVFDFKMTDHDVMFADHSRHVTSFKTIISFRMYAYIINVIAPCL